MNYLFYLFPITAVVSTAYSATRYEQPQRIVTNAIGLFIRITVFMLLALAVLWLLSWGQ